MKKSILLVLRYCLFMTAVVALFVMPNDDADNFYTLFFVSKFVAAILFLALACVECFLSSIKSENHAETT